MMFLSSIPKLRQMPRNTQKLKKNRLLMKRIVIHSNHTQEHSSNSAGWTSSTLFFFFQPKQDPTSFSFFLLLSSLLIFLPISSFRILFFSPRIWPPLPQNLFLNFVLYFFLFHTFPNLLHFLLKTFSPLLLSLSPQTLTRLPPCLSISFLSS